MKVAVMTGLRQIDYVERSVPAIQRDQVLVRVEYVGICGSDIHYYETGRIGPYVVEPPFVLGHEVSGKVVALGEDVSHLQIGDSVALEPGVTCGVCSFCRAGAYNLCPDVEFFATPPYDGVLQEYVAHKADLCFKLPDNVSTQAGAMIEPLAVGFHAAKQGNASLGKTAVVFGAGAIGLVSMMALQAMGVSKVYIVDILTNRLKKAKELGASEVIHGAEEQVVDKVLALEPAGVDIAIETAGSEDATNQAIRMLKKGSTLVMVGYSSSGKMNIATSLAMDKELTLKTVFRYRHIYPMAIEAVSVGKVDVEAMITDIFSFEDTHVAMEKSCTDKQHIVKAVIKMP